MRILLDTHALLWFNEDNSQLSERAKATILSKHNEMFVSFASLWEISVKSSEKRLRIGMDLTEFVERHVIGQGMNVLDLNISHLEKLMSMHWHHRDPFDRLIIAQAASERLTLISGDKNLSQYPVKILW